MYAKIGNPEEGMKFSPGIIPRRGEKENLAGYRIKSYRIGERLRKGEYAFPDEDLIFVQKVRKNQA